MRLIDRCLRLGVMPRQGRRRPEFGERVRSVAYGSYVVLYETEPEQVTILRIVHGARDLTALSLLRPEGE
jgi:toxin ParE1/3/4